LAMKMRFRGPPGGCCVGVCDDEGWRARGVAGSGGE